MNIDFVIICFRLGMYIFVFINFIMYYIYIFFFVFVFKVEYIRFLLNEINMY